MPTVDREANSKKKAIDALAAHLLDIDKEQLTRIGGDIAFKLLGPEPVKLLVTGGAGSGKTTLSAVIAERLNIPAFDFDEYVPGGYTPDGKGYRKRLLDGMGNLWDDLPRKTGWIIEHVEACNEMMVKSFHPTHCLLLGAPVARLLGAAQARGHVAEDATEETRAREKRALESSEYARMQFESAGGTVIAKKGGQHPWVLKKMG